MVNYLKTEFKRAIFSPNALISLIITLFILTFSFYKMFLNVKGFNLYNLKNIFDSIDIFISIRNDLLSFLAPLLASLIFSDSYLLDNESGFLKYIYSKISQKKYILIKLITNALISGLIISIALSITFIFLFFLLGIKETGANNVTNDFEFIYHKSRFLYVIFLIGVSFIFNVIFSTLSLGISTLVKNRYLAILSSFFYYIISGTLLSALGFYKLNATILFTLNPVSSSVEIILYQCILFFIGVILFYCGVLKRNEKLY